jgi:two-component system, NtrC family, sensor histidine kinase PilS
MNQPRLSAATARMGQVLKVMPEEASAGRPVRRAPLFIRLWLGFLTGRVMVAFVLLVLPVMLSYFGVPMYRGQLVMALLYFAVALVQRVLAGGPDSSQVSERILAFSVLVDIVGIAVLNDLSVRTVNYYALLALPLMYTSILGSRRVAMAAAAAVTLLLLSDAIRLATGMDAESTRRLTQAGLTGAGAWTAVLLVHYLSERLELEADMARAGKEAVRQQIQINEVVIDAMSMGVMVVDSALNAITINPAAARMLGMLGQPSFELTLPLSMHGQADWLPLCRLVELTFTQRRVQREVVDLMLSQTKTRSLQVTTRLTASDEARRANEYCVVFLEDTQDLEDRVRTEKLAAMGRMSAAVAHEIRNPLAAIAQANQLLAEDLPVPGQQKLSTIIAQNAKRLGQTVDDILEVSRFPAVDLPQPTVELQSVVLQTCDEWSGLHAPTRLQTFLPEQEIQVQFDSEHLRRVLVNLLDNALRHARGVENADIRVLVQVPKTSQEEVGASAQVCVWNAGNALDSSVAEHLFEPFFSSQSRSSGLGLFICRQLCDAHGARIDFERAPRPSAQGEDGEILGNQFRLGLQIVAS